MKTSLCAFAAALVLVVAACSPPAQQPAPAPQASSVEQERADADFGLRMALLEGHLRIGNALMEAGQKDNALPHFGHPVRELYSDMLPYIAAHQGQQFDRDLIGLESLAAARGDTPEYRSAFASVLQKVATARALIPEERFRSDPYTLALVADICTSASQEYRNAIIAGRVGSLIEYEDARGFMQYSSDLLANHQGTDPRLERVRQLNGELNNIVGPLDPPNPPRATPEDFEARAAQVRETVKAAPTP